MKKQFIRKSFSAGGAYIYNELVRYYNRSRQKLQSLALEGKNLRKQDILKRRIIRLFKTLTGLQCTLKLGMATAAMSAGLLLFQPNAASAQLSFAPAQINPFGLTDVGPDTNYSTPAFVDLDGDGDMDLMAGENNGSFFYYENIGTATAPAFAPAQENPFGLTTIGTFHYYSAPAFADLDGDGDMDLISGEFYGNFFYFENTGTNSSPAFAEQQINPFGLTAIPTSIYSKPAFADLDGDGDIDLIAGDWYGNFFYFKNIGSSSAPAFATAQENPFGLTKNGYKATPAFADLDGDGDIDLITGEFYGNFFYFQNIGTSNAPEFTDAQFNVPQLSDIGYYSTPACADLDGDGDLDLIAGEDSGNFFYFENYHTCTGIRVFADSDSDGYGNAANSLFTQDCIVPGGYVYDSTDCNDANALINPGTIEILNGIDDNCDGIIDVNCWTQKANLSTTRWGAVGFSIGSKGYIGTGYADGQYKNDFWEYDPDSNVWTQKANVGGPGRIYAVGFAINGKGYIGTGRTPSYNQNDFWEYDPITNAWIQKANFGGSARSVAVGFSIGGKGYIGTGNDIMYTQNDFWEYDPATDIWTQKSNFGGGIRYEAIGFSIGNKGYLGTGFSNNYKNDFWEYDPSTDVWTQKANFGGLPRLSAVGFSIGNKGYIGTGEGLSNPAYQNDFWEYDPETNIWTQKANFEGLERKLAVGFAIGSKGYIGTGYFYEGGYHYYNDLWEYIPETCSGLMLYADADNDGYGDPGNSLLAADCIIPSGYVLDSSDCEDNNPAIHPGACDVSNGNGIDDNCDGLIDNGFDATTYYIDADADGYGFGGGISLCSNPGPGYSTNNTDCNDANPLINPIAIEILNGLDDNCNGIIDDVGCAIPVNLLVSKITATSAKLKWDVVPEAEGYTVRYKVENVSGWKYGTTHNPSKPLSGLLPNTIYKWEVQTFCYADPPYVMSDWSAKQGFTTGSLRMDQESPQQVSFQIYPNPAEDHATFQFTLMQSSHVYIKLYDMSGKEIETLLDEDMEPGDHSLFLNTLHFPKGVYIVKMISDFGIETQKLIVQ